MTSTPKTSSGKHENPEKLPTKLQSQAQAKSQSRAVDLLVIGGFHSDKGIITLKHLLNLHTDIRTHKRAYTHAHTYTRSYGTFIWAGIMIAKILLQNRKYMYEMKSSSWISLLVFSIHITHFSLESLKREIGKQCRSGSVRRVINVFTVCK